MNGSPEIRQRPETDGNKPYLCAGPNRELPSPRNPTLMRYLSSSPYCALISALALLVCVVPDTSRRSLFCVRDGSEGSWKIGEAVLEVDDSCVMLLLS